MSFFAGDRVGDRFRLERELGSGTFGTVWLALDERSNVQVALKVLREEFANRSSVVNRFRREAGVLEQLDHPNIARLVSYGRQDQLHFFAMELIEGQTLKDDLSRITKSGSRYTLDRVLAIFGAIARGLSAAHEAGVIHRDLKSTNVMIATRGEAAAKILDFGIAKVLLPPGDQTTLGRRFGTLMYMSPEQFRGDMVDHRTDLFSAGVLLFEMLTSRRPFLLDATGQPLMYGESAPPVDHNSPYAVTRRIALDPRPRLSLYRTDVGKELDKILFRALSPDREQRFDSAAELLAAVQAALGSSTHAKPLLEETHAGDAGDAGDAGTTSVLPRRLTEPEPPATVATELEPRLEPATRAPVLALLLGGALLLLVIALSAGVLAPQAPVRAIAVERPETAPPSPIVVQERADPVPPPLIATEVAPPPPAVARAPTPKSRAPAPIDPAAAIVRAYDAGKNDPAAITRAALLLQSAADQLPDSVVRAEIRRCAVMSQMPADAKELAVCIDRYRRALPKE